MVVFDEDTPHALIAALQPDVLVKGADWADDAIVGRDIVEARGGRVVRMPLEPGYSTTRDHRRAVATFRKPARVRLYTGSFGLTACRDHRRPR